MPERMPVPKFVMPLFFGAVVLWGLYIGVGAYLRGGDWRKPLLVLACVAVFLGLWAGVLALARLRQNSNNKPS